MDLSSILKKAAIQYPKSKKGSFKGTKIGKVIKNEIPKELKNKLPLSDFKVQGSIGNGQFADIPWVAIMDNKITKSTREGIYIVFLFSSDGKRIYLTLNQGVTYFNEKKYKPTDIENISDEIFDVFSNNKTPKININLNASTGLGKGYEATTISGVQYTTSNMPSEKKLLSDIKTLLEDYANIKTFFDDNGEDIESFYEAIMEMTSPNKYKVFKKLLSRFVQQANKNLEDKENRQSSLGAEGFEYNQFTHKYNYDIIFIDGIEYHIHLFNSGSYGPTSGDGSSKIPFIDYSLSNGNWANIRTSFKEYKLDSFEIVEWIKYSGEDRKTGISYKVDELDLFSKEEPNSLLKEFLDRFLLLESEARNMLANNNIEELAEKLEKSKNIILRGAPGTGKTYLARQIAAYLTGDNEGNLNESEQYGFVQFHPSYDYTDFVEGLRPVIDEDQEQVSFKLVDGIFKEFCERAKRSGVIGGVDRFDDAWKSLILAINENEDDYMMNRSKVPATVNSNSSIKFKSPVATKRNVYKLYRGEDTNLKYETYQRIVLDHLMKEFGLEEYEKGEITEEGNKKYVFVIDEINRGEISKIFGELFFSIDPGYRGKEQYGINTQYSNLHTNTMEKFYIPDNVYIIGTMNDIDRSVDSFDFAMRRRFRFIEVKAEDMMNMWEGTLEEKHIGEATQRLLALNKQISDTDDLNANYHIGPSYFLKLPELDYNYEVLWEDYLQPLLEEYLRGSYEEGEKLAAMKTAYDSIKQPTEDMNDED